jgi:hypothetical protein
MAKERDTVSGTQLNHLKASRLLGKSFAAAQGPPLLLLATCIALCVACGGQADPPGSASVNGTYDGMPLSASVACGTDLPCAAGDTNVGYCGYIEVVISSRGANTCMESALFANSEQLVFRLSTETPAPGVYDVIYQGTTSAFFTTIGPNCGLTPEVPPNSGTVTISEASSTRLVGSYSVTFGTDGGFSGTFDVPIERLSPGPGPPIECIQ